MSDSFDLIGIAPYMENGGEWTKAKEMKNIISGLEMECANGECRIRSTEPIQVVD